MCPVDTHLAGAFVGLARLILATLTGVVKSGVTGVVSWEENRLSPVEITCVPDDITNTQK